MKLNLCQFITGQKFSADLFKEDLTLSLTTEIKIKNLLKTIS